MKIFLVSLSGDLYLGRFMIFVVVVVQQLRIMPNVSWTLDTKTTTNRDKSTQEVQNSGQRLTYGFLQRETITRKKMAVTRC